ncbi:kinase-like protein [Meira miltonrushii]|uniref:Kinase-like protein n=1 Tax=Meira miltonrushii TaxID=1280837 RepID=A0A316V0Y9_9BASI|nr:kinase-like protein [Meira miltonrushii]PWN31217.1 kinase-like protein [Meira miltonrushii]
MSLLGKYKLGNIIGTGGFAFVMSAARIKDGLKVAIKFIQKRKVSKNGWVNNERLGKIPKEAFILQKVDSPFIIKFIDLVSDEKYFYLITEHHRPTILLPMQSETCLYQQIETNINEKKLTSQTITLAKSIPQYRKGISSDLYDCLETQTCLQENTARWVFAQIVEGVYDLNKQGIYHRDIKDENCVIDQDFNVKLIDFGSAIILTETEKNSLFKKFYGTIPFASSEILKGELYRIPEAEVWSLGVLLYIILNGTLPFTNTQMAIDGMISEPRFVYSDEISKLITRCLQTSTEERATLEEIRQHPWVKRAWF